jgi:glycosyltransferase involved in cell wall biosynthesis
MKISIVTVCYNSESFIRSAIDSVLSQSHLDIEYIVIDGGSTDETINIVRSYGEKISTYVSEPDMGIYDAMNKGLALATGEVIGMLNSDDFYPNQNVITQVVKTFDANPNTHMVLGNVDFVKPDNLNRVVRIYSSFNFSSWKMRFGFMPAHPSAFIKRSAYEKVGNYKLGYKIGADFEWFIRAFMVKKLSYVKINKALVRMRQGGISTSGLKSNWITSNDMTRALCENAIYSNMLFVLIRLPIKYIQKIFRKG